MSTGYEDMVEAITWKATDPHGPMPASLAGMEEPYRSRSLAALQRMVDNHGTQGAMDIAAGLADAHHDAIRAREGGSDE